MKSERVDTMWDSKGNKIKVGDLVIFIQGVSTLPRLEVGVVDKIFQRCGVYTCTVRMQDGTCQTAVARNRLLSVVAVRKGNF